MYFGCWTMIVSELDVNVVNRREMIDEGWERRGRRGGDRYRGEGGEGEGRVKESWEGEEMAKSCLSPNLITIPIQWLLPPLVCSSSHT